MNYQSRPFARPSYSSSAKLPGVATMAQGQGNAAAVEGRRAAQSD
jgi:hypothetical protein